MVVLLISSCEPITKANRKLVTSSSVCALRVSIQHEMCERLSASSTLKETFPVHSGLAAVTTVLDQLFGWV
jgi:hypothetical protein